MLSEIERFRAEKDEFFGQHPQSPLTAGQKKDFDGLDYFPENPALRLEVQLEPIYPPEAVEIQTSTGETRAYQRRGRFTFTVDGQAAQLTVYAAPHGLFLPFVDALAGRETYGAGRYLEPEDLGGGRLRVDFNLAYNPYCAYNPNFSCPLTPFENRLKVPIRAGEKLFEGAVHE